MKSERLLNVLEQVDEQFIEEAAPGNKPLKKKIKNMVWQFCDLCMKMLKKYIAILKKYIVKPLL